LWAKYVCLKRGLVNLEISSEVARDMRKQLAQQITWLRSRIDQNLVSGDRAQMVRNYQTMRHLQKEFRKLRQVINRPRSLKLKEAC
jgi:hypothetical protein